MRQPDGPHIKDQIGSRALLPLNMTRTIQVHGWSLTAPDTRVHINLGRSRADNRGSFRLELID
jgi:hypothetical protein